MLNALTNPEQATTDYVFTIEGNIGCGKSTLLEILRQKIPNAHWIEEPVAEWQNLGGKNINMLQKYYKEPTRWGFTFQIFALFTRVQKLHQGLQRYPNKIKISERSILADKHVFSELMKDLGYMDGPEYEVFKSLYASFEDMIDINRTKIIYLRCPPEECYNRTKLRKRAEENDIPLSYLTLIHEKHEKWFKDCDPSKVLVIDASSNFRDEAAITDALVQNINKFMHNEGKLPQTYQE